MTQVSGVLVKVSHPSPFQTLTLEGRPGPCFENELGFLGPFQAVVSASPIAVWSKACLLALSLSTWSQ